jgi:hypothetical protein
VVVPPDGIIKMPSGRFWEKAEMRLLPEGLISGKRNIGKQKTAAARLPL